MDRKRKESNLRALLIGIRSFTLPIQCCRIELYAPQNAYYDCQLLRRCGIIVENIKRLVKLNRAISRIQ